MRSSDYTKEIGMTSRERSVPMPHALGILALVIGVGVLSVKLIHPRPTPPVAQVSAAAK